MVLLKDNEVKNFCCFDDAETFLRQQKEMDRWERVPIKFLEVQALPNAPIFLEQIMEEKHITVSEAAALSAMKDTELLLSYPSRSQTEVIPIRSTGITSLKERAKLSGTALQKMPCEKKAITLNCGLELWNEQSLILVRDEKISAIHSGDDGSYSILPMDELVKTLHQELEENYSGYELVGCDIGHDMTVITVEMPENMLDEFNKTLQRKGRKPIKGKPILKFASSDVGICGANLYPYIKSGGILIRIGDVIRLKHKNHATVEKFQDNCRDMYSVFKDVKSLTKLLQYQVKKPYDCFLAVAKKCGLPKKAVFEAVEDFEAFRPVECYAYDIYLGLWEITRYAKMENEIQLLNLEENISRAMNIDYANYDHTFSWN